MADQNPQELLSALYAPFAPEEHEVRELRKTKSGKVQWAVYIRREAITHRLDNLIPFEWEFMTNEPRREAEYVSVKGSLYIKGLARDNNGGARPKDFEGTMTEDVEKAAMTDCFKRCASSWGIGLYLQNSPDVYTEGYEKGDWDTMRQREQEALAKVYQWLRGEKPTAQPQRSNGTAKQRRIDTTERPPLGIANVPIATLDKAYYMVKGSMDRPTFDDIVVLFDDLKTDVTAQFLAKRAIDTLNARKQTNQKR